MTQRYARRTLLEQTVQFVARDEQIEITHVWSHIPSERIDQEETVLCLDMDAAVEMAMRILKINEKFAGLKVDTIPESKLSYHAFYKHIDTGGDNGAD